MKHGAEFEADFIIGGLKCWVGESADGWMDGGTDRQMER